MATLVEFKGKRPRIAGGVFLAPTAVLLGDVEIAEGTSIWFGAVLRADYGPIRIGPATNIQDNVVIHSETSEGTVLEERVTVGHAAILHNCWIGRGSLIGMGAILLTGSRIGPGSMVGAGAVVKEGFAVPPSTLAVGNPAVNKKVLKGKAAAWLEKGAESYTRLTREYEESYRLLRDQQT
jgi:carbonic anhydrase/acetyltransferase-like protein (isoleucine patch superfamily)